MLLMIAWQLIFMKWHTYQKQKELVDFKHGLLLLHGSECNVPRTSSEDTGCHYLSTALHYNIISQTSFQWRQSPGCQPSPGAVAAPSPPGGFPELCSATPPAAAGLLTAVGGDGMPGGRGRAWLQ